MTPLAKYRVGWGVAMIVQAGHDARLYEAFSPARFHVPLLAWIQPPSQGAFSLVVQVTSWGALCVALGLGTRVALAAVLLAQGYLFASDLLLFRNHVYLALLTGFLLVCAREQTFWPERSLPLGLLRLQTLIVYAWAAANKLRPSFLDGWTLQQELPHSLRGGLLANLTFDGSGQLVPELARVVQSDHAMMVCAWALVGVEAFLVVGLPCKALRPWAMLAGILLHAAIFVLMGVFTFGCLMVSSYVLFRDPPER